MNKQILFIAATAMCVSNTLIAASAHARGDQPPPSQRFDFSDNYYRLEEPTGRRRPSSPPSVQTTSVTQGAVPNASTMIGFNPAFLAQAPTTSAVSAQINRTPPAVPVQQPAVAYSQQFGQPAKAAAIPQQAKPAVTAGSATNHVSAKMMAPAQVIRRSHSASPRTLKPQHRKTQPPAVAKYGDDLYSPGTTKPTPSEFHATSEVNGKLIPKKSH